MCITLPLLLLPVLARAAVRGSVDQLANGASSFTVTGWAYDSDAPSHKFPNGTIHTVDPIRVVFTIDDYMLPERPLANRNRPGLVTNGHLPDPFHALMATPLDANASATLRSGRHIFNMSAVTAGGALVPIASKCVIGGKVLPFDMCTGPPLPPTPAPPPGQACTSTLPTSLSSNCKLEGQYTCMGTAWPIDPVFGQGRGGYCQKDPFVKGEWRCCKNTDPLHHERPPSPPRIAKPRKLPPAQRPDPAGRKPNVVLFLTGELGVCLLICLLAG
jgi:hypothetical protein